MSDHNPGLRPWRDIARRDCRQIMVGTVPIGGGAPITVQTMTNTPPSDPVAPIDQTPRCEEAGARKSVVWGKRVSVRVDLGGRRIHTKKTTRHTERSNNRQRK